MLPVLYGGPALARKKYVTCMDFVAVSLTVLMFWGIMGSATTWIEETGHRAKMMEEKYGPPPEQVWLELSEEVLAQDGYTNENGETGADGGTLRENVTSIEAVLTWSDDIGSNDELELVLVINGTEEATSSSTSGSASVSHDLGGQYIEGDLSLIVRALDCPGVVGPLPVDRDTGNSWSVSVTVTYEELEVG